MGVTLYLLCKREIERDRNTDKKNCQFQRILKLYSSPGIDNKREREKRKNERGKDIGPGKEKSKLV